MKKSSAFLMEVSSPNLMVVEKVTADCYATVRLDVPKTAPSGDAHSGGSALFRTRTIPQKLNPFWCEEFTLDVPAPVTIASTATSPASNSGPVLKITLWDANKYDADEVCTCCTFGVTHQQL
jgi:hypothetical protein